MRLIRPAYLGRAVWLVGVSLAACSSSSADQPTADAPIASGSAAQLVIQSGNNQSGEPDSPLAQQLTVGVTDDQGLPVAGAQVMFVLTGGDGVVSDATVVTGEPGIAATTFTPGPSFGTDTVQAQCLDVTPVTFTETAVNEVSQIVVTSGDHQSGVVASTLAAPLVVTVEDASHAPIPNVAVQFAVASGDSTLAPLSAYTDGSGQTSALLTLGETAGSTLVEVTAHGGATATITATGIAGPAAKAELVGTPQVGTVGQPFPAPTVVAIEDEFGNPVAAGDEVAFSMQFGTPSPTTATTDAEGHVQTAVTLGTLALDDVDLELVITDGSATPASTSIFVGQALAGSAAQLVLLRGDDQGGRSGATLPLPLDVEIEDEFGNQVNGTSVDFAVTAGGGAIVGSNASSAIQEAQWTLGTSGLNTAEITAPGLAGSPIVLHAEAMAGLATAANFTVGSAPFALAVGDLNGDGKPDLAVANSDTSASSVSVLLDTTATGATPPSFSTASFTTQVSPQSVALADFNGDGRLDVVAANVDSADVSVFVNTTPSKATTPSFAQRTDVTTGVQPSSVAAGDFNGDGKPDLAVANYAASTVSVLLDTTATGAAAAHFAAKVDIASASGMGVGSGASGIAVADLNGDGKPDVVVANSNSNTVSVLLDTTATAATTPTFAAPLELAAGGGATAIAIGDLDGDGKPDLVISNVDADSVSVFLNTTATGATTASFATRIDLAALSAPYAAAIGDLNGDGLPDIAVADSASGTVSVLLQLPSASGVTFAQQLAFFDFAGAPMSIAIADINADGNPDVVITNGEGDTVSVLLSN